MQTGKFQEAEEKLRQSIKMQPNPSYEDAFKAVVEMNEMEKKLKDGGAIVYFCL